MRTLAQRLDSGTATLYRHFGNRSELVAQVVDRVFSEVDHDDLGAMTWQEECKAFARRTFGALRRHPNVAPLLVEQVPMGPYAVAGRERVIALLLDNGFSPTLAARSFATVARHVLGFAIQLTGPGDASASEEFRGLNPVDFPATTRVADHLPVPLEDEFEFGLDLILLGLTEVQRRGSERGRADQPTTRAGEAQKPI